jgi:hypothetical protein
MFPWLLLDYLCSCLVFNILQAGEVSFLPNDLGWQIDFELQFP